MHHHTTALALLAVALPCLAASDPPLAEQRTTTSELHGDVRRDEYAWLRNREDPAVIAYLEAENAYTEEMTAHTAALQEALYGEMIGRIKQTDLSVPFPDGPYFYYSRTVEGLDYRIYCRKLGSLEAEEEIILDVNDLARDNEYLRVTSRGVSPDHRYLAYAVDTTGYETVNVSIKDLNESLRNQESLIEELEARLSSVGDDSQLANIDLQNNLQKQQQILQTISNVSKMLHDTAMAVIRKIG